MTRANGSTPHAPILLHKLRWGKMPGGQNVLMCLTCKEGIVHLMNMNGLEWDLAVDEFTRAHTNESEE